MIGNDESNIPQEYYHVMYKFQIFVYIWQINDFATDVKLSKTQIYKIVYSDWFQLLGPLQLAKNVLTSQAKSVFIPLRFIAAALAVNAGIQKNMCLWFQILRS